MGAGPFSGRPGRAPASTQRFSVAISPSVRPRSFRNTPSKCSEASHGGISFDAVIRTIERAQGLASS